MEHIVAVVGLERLVFDLFVARGEIDEVLVLLFFGFSARTQSNKIVSTLHQFLVEVRIDLKVWVLDACWIFKGVRRSPYIGEFASDEITKQFNKALLQRPHANSI